MLFVVTLCAVLPFTSGIRFILLPNRERCLGESVNKDVIVTGQFEVEAPSGMMTAYQVTDSKGHVLSRLVDIKRPGKFSFVTEHDDMYEICFSSKVIPGFRGSSSEVFLDVRHGAEAKSFDALMDAGKLKPFEVELKRLEEFADEVVEDFVRMRANEKILSDTNESTNTKVFYLGIFSILCLLSLASWQVLYLRSYFISKKLIT